MFDCKAATSLVIAALCAGLCACESNNEAADLQIETRVNPAVDFTFYSRFEVLDPLEYVFEPPPPNYEDLNPSILGAIERELVDHGLVRARPPELVANPRIHFVNEDGEPDTYGAYWGFDEAWVTPPFVTEPGTLIVDVVDVGGTPDDQTDDVSVFKGTASGFRGQSIETIQSLVFVACEEIFLAWPVP